MWRSVATWCCYQVNLVNADDDGITNIVLAINDNAVTWFVCVSVCGCDGRTMDGTLDLRSIGCGLDFWLWRHLRQVVHTCVILSPSKIWERIGRLWKRFGLLSITMNVAHWWAQCWERKLSLCVFVCTNTTVCMFPCMPEFICVKIQNIMTDFKYSISQFRPNSEYIRSWLLT